MDHLQHFSHHQHPLVFNENWRIGGFTCYGCGEDVYGPSYSCPEAGCPWYLHHKSCAELPLGLHHPLHPKHPLILFPKWRYNKDDVKEYSKCEVCKEDRPKENHYRCSRCDFNLHIRCADLPLTIESEVHDHPLTRIWKLLKFTCDLCGKEGHGAPYLCAPCNFWTHKSCASCLRRVKVIRHKHPLDLIHSLEVHQSNSRFCQICVQKVDTDYGLYYCSECDFVAHLDCAMDSRNKEELKDEESTEQSVNSAAYEVKKTNVGKDGIEIATEIEHFSHEHDLKLSDEVQNNKICNGCVRAIHPPFYSCGECSFFLHKSCVELPRRKRHPLHQHSLTLHTKTREWCDGCWQICNGFSYSCEGCGFNLDVQCSLISAAYEVKKTNVGKDGTEIATEIEHFSHEHDLKLSDEVQNNKTCDGCVRAIHPPFYSCGKCSFFLHKSCVELPIKKQHPLHQHPLTLFPNLAALDFECNFCQQNCNRFIYYCDTCGEIILDVQCSLISDILSHPGHEHQLILSSKQSSQNCSCCDNNIYPIFRCTTCEFALDFKCATLPLTARYEQHEHPFTLSYTAEDDSGEYYCDICEEERNPKHWFYYCKDCTYPAHPECILGKGPNVK